MDLRLFKQDKLFNATLTFFRDTIGLQLQTKSRMPIDLESQFETFDIKSKKVEALWSHVDKTYYIGLLDDDTFEKAIAEQEKSHLKEDLEEVDESDDEYPGILIFAVDLGEGFNPTRSNLTEINRTLNRFSQRVPALVLARYGNKISLMLADRVAYKQEWREGEKVRKVSLLRDIDLDKPHAGHLRILKDLVVPTSGTKKVETFDGLYEYWKQVLDTNELNRKFYQDLSNWYFWAIKHVRFPDEPTVEDAHKEDKNLDDMLQEHRATNVIRLLTRLLFIWFIKEKKLIPEELFDLKTLQKDILKEITPHQERGMFKEANKESVYYKAILQNLYFATLNCPIEASSTDNRERGFRSTARGVHFGVTYLMRYEKYFKDKDAFLKLVNSKVPFLNGGLFECLDIRGEKEKKEDRVYIDGFSDNLPKEHKLIVPDFLFFGVEEHVDLSEDYGLKSKKYKEAAVRGLLNIFKSYKFTITENTPIEEDVALDPELLGKVFENLLASYNPETKTTARKQTGSFYTPREIVNYMVDESLIAYLKNVPGNVPGASSFGSGIDISGASSFGSGIDISGASSFGSGIDISGASSFGSGSDISGASSFGSGSDISGASSFGSGSDIPGASSFGSGIDISGASSLETSQSNDALETMFFNPNDEIEIKQGKLPHWYQKEVFYHVTFRLADSIPKNKVEELKIDRENWQKRHKDKKKFTKEEWKEYNRLFNQRVEGWMNAGYGSRLLKKKENAEIVANALKHFNGQRYDLDEWVVMPNHVHVLVKPLGEHKLSDILHSWKSFTANEINKREGRSGQLWMHESFDHIVRNEDALNAIRHYIRQNPAKAGINVPEASSFGESQSEYQSESQSQSESESEYQFRFRSKDASDTLFHQLLSYEETVPFEDDEVLKREIITALSNCTILDPACGSGAFPMGALQKMVHVLHKLDPENRIWKEVQKEKASKEADRAISEIEDKEERGQRLQEINEAFDERINAPDYARKLFLIENCIYGVDIQPVATQISKLRFFISLVVEQKVGEDKSDNFGIRPLPNLETKFVTANTLIDIEKPKDGQLNIFGGGRLKVLENELKKVRSKLFGARTTETKFKYRKKDEKLRNEIAEELKKTGWPNDAADKLASWDPYDQNASSTFFNPEWMFDINHGFDVVIGNPPYGASYDSKQKKYFKSNYRSSKTIRGVQKGSLDTFTLFIESGFKYLKNNGNLTFIVPISITSSDSMTGIQRMLESNCKLIKISSYSVRPQPIFLNAVVNTSILHFIKTNSQCQHILSTKMYRKSDDFDIEWLINNLEFCDIIDYRLRGRYPKISLDIETSILDKIFNKGPKIGELMKNKGEPIYYRTTGGRYFKVVTNYPTGSSKEKAIYFDKGIANPIGALMSSNLYFWFYQIYSNNLDLKSYEVEIFNTPFRGVKSNVLDDLSFVYEEYLEDIEKNCNERSATGYSNINSFKEYKIGYSKNYIDKIDDILASMYGLSNNELEFIKNYELQFRMSDDYQD